MSERQDPQQQYAFKAVQLFKKDTLGTGSYGAVCKAKCDQLLCAAKLLYPVLFQMQAPDSGKEHRRPFRRFEEECQFLSRINHPNIVQYLGTYRDPETNAPVLLMELMDENLTHFLKSSPGDLPYHTQVNLSYDIAQALAFLHSNGIIHRDLSSNNVLLLASTRAKVTDFGMSKFTDLNTTRLATMTTCPGTPAFMSPEALNEPPVYTEKLDNFSFGVLLVQITTRQFPNPTDQFETREFPDPRLQNRLIQVKVPVPELERRQAHIDLIPPDHPLLPTALHCLKDNDRERPTATQLCQTLIALKRTARYQESSPQDLHQLLREKDEQLRANQEALAQKDAQIQAKENIIAQKNVQLQTKERDLDQATQNTHTFHCEQESNVENCAALQQAIQQRERKVRKPTQALPNKNKHSCRQVLVSVISLAWKNVFIWLPVIFGLLLVLLTSQLVHVAIQEKTLTVGRWESLLDIPGDIGFGSLAVTGSKIYVKPYSKNTVYELTHNQWNKLPSCPDNYSLIVSIDNILTTVGIDPNSKLYSYIHNQWIELFPSLPTKRAFPTAVYTKNILIVAGGYIFPSSRASTTVEILNTANRQWSSVSSLPVKMQHSSATICGDYVYIHPHNNYEQKNFVYKCSLEQLVQSQPSSAIWEKITSLPVTYSSLTTVNGHLLAVGGQEATGNDTNNIYQYINTSWTVVGQLTSPQSNPITAILPGNKLMVMGEKDSPRKRNIATIY